MATLTPPPAPPIVTTDDDGRYRRFRFRLFQVGSALATTLATVWLFTLGAIPGILGLLVAKHVLVAILMMRLGVDAPQPKK